MNAPNDATPINEPPTNPLRLTAGSHVAALPHGMNSPPMNSNAAATSNIRSVTAKNSAGGRLAGPVRPDREDRAVRRGGPSPSDGIALFRRGGRSSWTGGRVDAVTLAGRLLPRRGRVVSRAGGRGEASWRRGAGGCRDSPSRLGGLSSDHDWLTEPSPATTPPPQGPAGPFAALRDEQPALILRRQRRSTWLVEPYPSRPADTAPRGSSHLQPVRHDSRNQS